MQKYSDYADNCMERTPAELSRVFNEFRNGVSILLEKMPAIHHAVGDGAILEEHGAWRAMNQRPREFVERGGKPILVGTMFGPTRAGKSTVFNLLTGLHAPTGVTGPISRQCSVAVPDSLAVPETVRSLFPGYEPVRLDDPKWVCDPKYPNETLFYETCQMPATQAGIELVLADVPDFNSVAQENWAKAEKMLSRAEVVVFLTYPEGYIDDRVISQLREACLRAGALAYLITKTTREDAAAIWEHLFLQIETNARISELFRERRKSDGLSLREFLGRVRVYFSEPSGTPLLRHIQPLRGSDPPFISLLAGLDGGRILLSSLIEATSAGEQLCREILGAAEERERELRARIEKATEPIAAEAQGIAGTEFQFGRMLAILIEVAHEAQPKWLRVPKLLTGAISSVALGIWKLEKKLTGWMKGKKKDRPGDLKQRPDLEYQRLSETADRLIDVWRSQFPGETREGGLLRSESCQRARENFLKQQPPPPGSDWEAVVRRGAKTWTKEHPFLCATLAATADFGTVAGAAVMVIDLAHGGLGAVVLHHAAAAAGAGAAVTLAVKLFEYLHLVEVQAAAHEKWTQQRAAELAEHIEQNFAKPLFLGLWQEALEALQDAPAKECKAACEVLTRLSAKFSNTQ